MYLRETALAAQSKGKSHLSSAGPGNVLKNQVRFSAEQQDSLHLT